MTHSTQWYIAHGQRHFWCVAGCGRKLGIVNALCQRCVGNDELCREFIGDEFAKLRALTVADGIATPAERVQLYAERAARLENVLNERDGPVMYPDPVQSARCVELAGVEVVALAERYGGEPLCEAAKKLAMVDLDEDEWREMGG